MRRSGRAEASVFLDTQGLAAAINTSDPYYPAARRAIESAALRKLRIYTSDWVLAEFLSVCSRGPIRSVATMTVLDLRASPLTTVVEATRAIWDRAFAMFRDRSDKEWSLVDCTTIVLCESLGVRRVLTHDHHFVQAGLDILIP